jgi:Virulence-associated protein E
MSDTAVFTRRLQLAALGYQILPNLDKRCFVKSWPSAEFSQRELSRIETWPGRWPEYQATGLRIQDGLAVIDIDVDDEAMVERILELISRVAPEIGLAAPTRHGGGQYKIALFARTDITEMPDKRPRSHKYRRPGEEDHHAVEIFLSVAGRADCHRQFGIDGPHSYLPDGAVKAAYVWAEGVPALWDVTPDALPVLSLEAARAIVDGFDGFATAAGWERLSKAKNAAGNGVIIADIDAHTRFDLEDGSTVEYADLAEGMRCTSSFHGDVGSNATKCLVGAVRVRNNVLGVWDFEEGAWHVPAPVDISAELRAMAAAHGLEIPLSDPNWRDRYRSGAPKPSLANARLAIEHSAFHGAEDTFHGRIYLGRSDAASPSEPLLSFLGEMTDSNLLGLRCWLDTRYGIDFGEKNVRDATLELARANRFDPVVDMLAEAQASWDGVARLDRMAVDYFNGQDTPWNRAFVRKTMIAAVARARNPGCKFDTILVMESPEGWNKSSVWRCLAGDDNFSDASIIGHAGREVQEHLAAIWIHENAELAGMRKAEVETVKAFASRQEDRARPAYGHFLVNQPRHSIEVGTTNSDAYLMSQNGNRRFWPMRVLKPIDLARLRAARLQLWGEAAHWQSQGESLVLDERLWAKAGDEQEKRRIKHPWEDILAGMTVRPDDSPLKGVEYIKGSVQIIHRVKDEERVATATIFRMLEIPNGQLDIRHSRTLAEVMRTLGWEHCVFKADEKAVKGYRRTLVTVGY